MPPFLDVLFRFNAASVPASVAAASFLKTAAIIVASDSFYPNRYIMNKYLNIFIILSLSLRFSFLVDCISFFFQSHGHMDTDSFCTFLLSFLFSAAAVVHHHHHIIYYYYQNIFLRIFCKKSML